MMMINDSSNDINQCENNGVVIIEINDIINNINY